MRQSASFVFSFSSSHLAEIVAKSLSVEASEEVQGATVSIDCVENKVEMKISAVDLSVLRAASNSYLRWMNTACEVADAV